MSRGILRKRLFENMSFSGNRNLQPTLLELRGNDPN